MDIVAVVKLLLSRVYYLSCTFITFIILFNEANKAYLPFHFAYLKNIYLELDENK